MAAVALGLMYVGSGNGEVIEAVLQVRCCCVLPRAWLPWLLVWQFMRHLAALRCCSSFASIMLLHMLASPLNPACTSILFHPSGLQAMMLRGEADLQQPVAKLMCLALGLLFLGRQDAVEPTVEVRASAAVEHEQAGCWSCLVLSTDVLPRSPPPPHP